MSDGSEQQSAVEDAASDALEAAMSIAFGIDPATERRIGVDGASTMIGRYKLLEQIGEGGFGVVYMAEQQEPIRRRVALKVIKQGMDTKQVVARFEAERQALAMMDHENIASVLDAGATETGRPYFVMELVRGVPITEYCDRNKLNTHARLKLFTAVCNAVQHAHQKGIIHRDLKPSNVMVTLRDGAPIPKVIDFGVAKATQVRLTEKTVFTRYGQFIGTPAYMSPEQVEMSEFDVDTRTDIYSLGVLLYELLTGSTPIEHEKLRRASYSEMQRMICEQEPLKPSSRLSHSGEALASISAFRGTDPKRLGQIVRGELDWIVMKSLDKDRSRRYETANGLAMDVQRYLSGDPVTASPPSTTYKLRKFARKHRRLIGATMAFVILLLASTLVSTWLAIREGQAKAEALRNEGLANEQARREKIAREEMTRQRDLAKKLGTELDHQLEHTQRLLYAAHMNTIGRELAAGNDPIIIELLNSLRPRDDQRDLRGFEWYYAWGLCHRNPRTWPHDAMVMSVVCSPDGGFIISGSSDGQLRVWSAESGQMVSAIKAHEHSIRDIAIAASGAMIATSSNDRTVKIWRFESGALYPTSKELASSGIVRCVALSPDGTHLAAGSETVELGALKLWNLDSGVHHDIDIEREWVYGVTFSRDSKKLASASVNIVNICDVATAKVTGKIKADLPHLASLAFSPTDDTLAWGGTEGEVELWSEATGSQRLGRLPGFVIDLAFSPDGGMLASAGSNLTTLWDVKTKTRVDQLRGHSAGINAIAFAPQGEMIVSASSDRTLKQWDLTRKRPFVYLPAQEAAISCLAFSPTDGQTLIAGSEDGSVKQWKVDRAEVANTLPSYGGKIRCVAVSPNGMTVAYAGGRPDQPSDVVFWDSHGKAARRTGKRHRGAIRAIAFSPDGETLASAGEDGQLLLWDVATATVKNEFEGEGGTIVSLAYSPNGRLIATGSIDQTMITVWDIENPVGRRRLEGHRDGVTSVSFSPNGSILASGSREGTLRVWDMATRTERFATTGHANALESLAFSPDGETLASAGRDDQLILWDVVTGKEKAKLDCQVRMEGGSLVAFSSDGMSLAAPNDRSVVVYHAVSGDSAIATAGSRGITPP